MTAISIQVEGQAGLTWPRWKRMVAEVEDFGFAGLFRSDHFTMPAPPDEDALELMVSLAYLADHSRRIHFGSLVAPLTFRHPSLLAYQAAALDALSEGRMILGVGSGWQEREHRAFGYDLGEPSTRMARLEEGLEVVTRLLRSDAPVTYEGRFYQLREARVLTPRVRPGGPRILVGGNGPRRTLALAARYADVWNAFSIAPEVYRERCVALDDLLRASGRQPGDVRRTVMAMLVFGRDTAELERHAVRERRNKPALADLPLDALLPRLRTDYHRVAGTPEQVIEQIRAYAQAGAEEIVFQWYDLDDVESLRAFAATVLPHV